MSLVLIDNTEENFGDRKLVPNLGLSHQLYKVFQVFTHQLVFKSNHHGLLLLRLRTKYVRVYFLVTRTSKYSTKSKWFLREKIIYIFLLFRFKLYFSLFISNYVTSVLLENNTLLKNFPLKNPTNCPAIFIKIFYASPFRRLLAFASLALHPLRKMQKT